MGRRFPIPFSIAKLKVETFGNSRPMKELLALMSSMARILASGGELTLDKVIRDLPSRFDEASGHVDPSGDFFIDGVLESGAAFNLSGLVSRRRMLMIWFREGYAVEGSVAQLTPHHGKRIHPSPRDDGYLVAYDLHGVDASFLVSPTPERVILMTCAQAPLPPPLRHDDKLTPFERLANLFEALQRQNVSYRLDRHGSEEVTVTFVWGQELIEAYFENGDKIWFSHFPKSPAPLDAEGVMKLIDEYWRDDERRGRRDHPNWAAVVDPFACMIAYTRMLDREGITWRMDSFDGWRVTVFLSLVSVRVEAYADRDGLTFTAYIGSEDVFPLEEMQAMVPGLSLHGARSRRH